jgi:hypothetical protein
VNGTTDLATAAADVQRTAPKTVRCPRQPLAGSGDASVRSYSLAGVLRRFHTMRRPHWLRRNGVTCF